MNCIIQKYKSNNDLARYLHGSTFSPVTSTFQQSTNNGNFITWPRADAIDFEKYHWYNSTNCARSFRPRAKNFNQSKPLNLLLKKRVLEKILIKTDKYYTVIISAPEYNKKEESHIQTKPVNFLHNFLGAIHKLWFFTIMMKMPYY